MSSAPAQMPEPSEALRAHLVPPPGDLTWDAREEWTAVAFRRAREAPASGREAIHEEIIRAYLEPARALSRRFRNRGVPDEDLEQVASAALVQVVRSYDVDRGGTFLAYAVPCIRGMLKRHFRDCGWMVRPPRRVQDLQREIRTAEDELTQRLGRSPKADEVAAQLGVCEDDVIESLAARGCFSPASLDRPVPGREGLGDSTLGDCLAGSSSALNAAEARTLLGPALRQLQERDRRIVKMRFFDGQTQQEIADAIGVTQMQVSRLLTRILRQMRQSVLADDEAASA